METLSLTTFTEHLHSQFQVVPQQDVSVPLEMVEARDLGSTPRQEQFVITFRGPLEQFLPQRTYRVEHPALGAFDLFLVPVGREPQGFQYEAIFNRLVEDR